ncbi:MAG TPA: DUF2877 domain-containing protein [Anaerolineales bacterium]|nr:DUF2877 domain-containing protein [Anaerolineales bacterium]
MLIAPHARAWLAGPGGRLTHVFDAAAYALNRVGDVLALTSEQIGPGPLSLVIRAPSTAIGRLSPGAEVSLSQECLEVDGLRVRLTTAEGWDSRPPWQELLPLASRLRSLWPLLRDLAIRFSPRGSLAGLLEDVDRSISAANVEGRVLAKAREGVPALRAALRSELLAERSDDTASEIDRAAQCLAGLGGGFTPAGDDFLLGVMYALWSAIEARHAAAASRTMAEAAARRTTTVSAAYLRAAAAGAAAQPWHALVESQWQNEPYAMERAVAQICRVGHTSGSDALAGYLIGLKEILGPR